MENLHPFFNFILVPHSFGAPGEKKKGNGSSALGRAEREFKKKKGEIGHGEDFDVGFGRKNRNGKKREKKTRDGTIFPVGRIRSQTE